MATHPAKAKQSAYEGLKFASLEDFKSMFTEVDNETAYAWAEDLGVEWVHNYNEGINRMRVSMALQRHYFPDLFKPKEPKKKMRYGDLTTKELEKLAKDNGIRIPKHQDGAAYRLVLVSELKRHSVGIDES